MIVQPDTYIRLIKNCPLDKTYDHTIYFESESDQIAYFKTTLNGITFTKQSYQRYALGVLHIQAKAEDLYGCNYLMFQNSSFGNKYFYAFVTSVEYVNNVSSKVYYEIDVMQTWFFDYQLEQCFVEREHSEYDRIGDNLVPECLETGEFILDKLDVTQCPFSGGEYDIIVLHGTNKLEVNGEYECVLSNVFNGLDVNRYTTPSAAYDALKTINNAGKSDSVVAVYMIPKVFWGTGDNTEFNQSNIVTPISNGLERPYFDNFDGFVPKNKKLYTEPYFGLMCASSSGNTHKYAYEYFDDPINPKFGMVFSIGATPECVLTPWNYKGVTENYSEEITCNDFPPCTYATDSFKAYIAQNAGRLTAELGVQLIGTANAQRNYLGVWDNPRLNMEQTTRGVDSYAPGLASNILSTVGALRDASIVPPKVRGSGASITNYTRNTVGFIFYKYKIRKEFAVIIDGFFNMFGYATRQVKYPNRNSRPHWNYVKTKGCIIHGSIPADDMRLIHSIYDSGITFWKDGSEIGKYYLDNSPVYGG